MTCDSYDWDDRTLKLGCYSTAKKKKKKKKRKHTHTYRFS